MKMSRGATQSCWLLLTLTLKGILAGNWSVQLPSSPICAVVGSSVVLPCSFDFPQGSNETEEEGQISAQDGGEYKVLSTMWCLEDSRCITPSYVFHSAGIFQDPSYQNRVAYLGKPGSQNCSLKISDVRQSDSGAYMFYVITSHPTQKMPPQSGAQLLVADSSNSVTVLATPTDITEGGSLQLTCCNPAADPLTPFRWYMSSSTGPRHTGQVWSISKVTSDDSGDYFCETQSGDRVQNSTMLPIHVQYSPRNTAMSISPAEERRDQLSWTLTCSSDANPPVRTYSWYQGAACLPSADKSSHPSRQTPATGTARRQTISSATITTEDYGVHCCVARNRHGSQTNTKILKKSKESAGGRALLIGGTICVLLIILAIVACVTSWKRKSGRRQSYVLTETTSTAP